MFVTSVMTIENTRKQVEKAMKDLVKQLEVKTVKLWRESQGRLLVANHKGIITGLY